MLNLRLPCVQRNHMYCQEVSTSVSYFMLVAYHASLFGVNYLSSFFEHLMRMLMKKLLLNENVPL
jgi:hypothetical protein